MWWRDSKPVSLTDRYYCEERQPLGFVERELTEAGHARGSRLARTLAVYAQLESAAELAQIELETAARQAGAPDALLRKCRQAVADERAHAEILGGWARAHGADLLRPKVEAPEDRRAAVVFALNAVEGCVHAAFAAVMADISSQRATSGELRRMYRRIAEDEARHTELAWGLHRWYFAQVGDSERATLVLAQGQALERLPSRAVALAHRVPPCLGRPRGETLRGVARRFVAELYARRSSVERQHGLGSSGERIRASRPWAEAG